MTEDSTEDSKVELTPEVIASVDPAYWAWYNKIVLAHGGVFSFEDRQYLIEPMQSREPVVCAMKATGGGFSECMGILPSLHGMRYGRYPQGVGYYFPTDTDMQAYVKGRFNPLIQLNKESIGRFLKQSKGTDSADVKRIGTSTLYLRGSTLTNNADGDAKQSTKLSGIQFDRLVVDEIDQIDSEAIAKMRHRMDAACCDGIKGNKEERYIANPSDEDRGIDLYWQKSDQRFWWTKCECGEFTCTIKEFLSDPEKSVGIYPNGTLYGKGYMKCHKCGKPLGRKEGEYRADKPSQKGLVGYHWCHLDSAYHDPAVILKDFRNPPENNLADIYRLDLGVAYSPKEDKLRKDTVFACCGNDGIYESHKGPCAMGVDNDDGKHVVIGIRTDNERFEILKVARVDNFQMVHDLAQKFNVKSAIVDLRPNADSAREFQKAERYKIFLCEYTDSVIQDYTFNENTGIVKVYRTGIFDNSHRIITNGLIRLPRQCAPIEDFAQQCCNCVKSKEENKTTRKIVYRYKKTGNGNDHYRNALNYFLVACSGHRVAVVNSNRTRKQTNASLR